MYKIFLVLILFFLISSLIAQSNLVIDSISIPVRVRDNKIKLKKGKNTTLKVPVSGTVDTIVTFSPETYGERIKIIGLGPNTEPTHIKNIKVVLKRSTFLENPLVYLSHNGLDYTSYKFLICYFHQDKYIGLGFDDEKVACYSNYSLRYFKITTLQDFKHILKEELPKDIFEFYITGVEFISVEAKEKLLLADTFKIELKK